MEPSPSADPLLKFVGPLVAVTKVQVCELASPHICAQ